MGDAWDDDDFEVQLPVGPSDDVPLSWEDEALTDEPVIKHGSQPKLSKEKAAKENARREAQKKAAIEAALQEDETDEQRRLRERNDIEEADHALTDELFGGGAAQQVVGLDAYDLSKLAGYVTLAHDIADRFETSKAKPNYKSKFLKEVVGKLESSLTIEMVDELQGILSAARHQKELAKKKPTAPKTTQKKATKTKKDMKKEADAHADLFGGFVHDELDHYDDQFNDEFF